MYGSNLPGPVTDLLASAERNGTGIIVFNENDTAIFSNHQNDKVYPFVDFKRCPSYDEVFWACIRVGNFAPGELIGDPEVFIQNAKRIRRETDYSTFIRRHSTGRTFMVFLERLPGFGSYIARLDVTDQMRREAGSLFGPVAWSHLAAREERSPLERLEVAAAVVERDGRILDANLAMRELLDRRDGLISVSGRLVAETALAAEALAAAVSIRAAAQGPDALLRVPRPSSAQGLVVSICSELPPRWSLGRAPKNAALVTVVEPDAPPSVNAQDLKSIYGLTKTEAIVATRIGCGETIADIAQQNGSSVNTLRNQVASVLSKTGLSRQADLVRIVMNIGRLCRRSQR